MGREATTDTQIIPAQVEAYLRRRGHPDAKLSSLTPLGQETQAGLKAFGYGRPLRVDFTAGGKARQLVIRTMSPDPFGHSRRADRAEQMVLAFDRVGTIPDHIQPVDVGAFGPEGELAAIPEGEFFLVTNYVEGELYAQDLHAIARETKPRALDLDRARALARYLAELHRQKEDPAFFARHLRDTVGSGEGIFGQCDGYPGDDPVVTPQRLRAIEHQSLEWRWKLKERSIRCCRTHGDFHPFNILFRAGTDFSVLDCSRGGLGEAADDLIALSINYIFFAMGEVGQLTGAMVALWDTFWETYLEASGDREVLDVVAPYFAWRTLVLVSPRWYPDLDRQVRERLLAYAESLLGGAPFVPGEIRERL